MDHRDAKIAALTKGGAFRRRSFLVAFIVCASLSASAQTITAFRIGGSGNVSTSQGNCSRAISSIGQPGTQMGTGGAFIVQTGFLIGRGDLDSIFHHGFEECS